MTRFALLETSQRRGFVALAQEDSILGVLFLDEARRHARDLVPALAELLRRQGCPVRELDAVVVGRGPGSYTGLRVGIMSAKTLAYASGCALLAIETFAIIARQSDARGRVFVVADAQQGKVYVQSFDRDTSGPLEILPWENAQERFGPGDVVTGPGLEIYADRVPSGMQREPPENWLPRPESLLQLALEKWRQGLRDDVYAVEPLYLRPSSAEENYRPKPSG